MTGSGGGECVRIEAGALMGLNFSVGASASWRLSRLPPELSRLTPRAPPISSSCSSSAEGERLVGLGEAGLMVGTSWVLMSARSVWESGLFAASKVPLGAREPMDMPLLGGDLSWLLEGGF